MQHNIYIYTHIAFTRMQRVFHGTQSVSCAKADSEYVKTKESPVLKAKLGSQQPDKARLPHLFPKNHQKM